METTIFAISAAAIILMVSLRVLEIKYQKQIILSHVTLPVDRRARHVLRRLAFRKETLIERLSSFVAGLRLRALLKAQAFRAGVMEYYEFLGESFRGKRMLSRGSVSFFLLNISDYNVAKKQKPVPVKRDTRLHEIEVRTEG